MLLLSYSMICVSGLAIFDFGDTIFASSIWWFSDIFESDFWTGDFAACA